MDSFVPLILPVCLLVAPTITGFLMGRYCPLLIRFIPVVPVLYFGYQMCAYSGHSFNAFYRFPLAFYILGDIAGLFFAAKKQETGFWRQYHVDWITLVAALIVFSIVYVPPMA